MNNQSLMQQALGEQWHQLPNALKLHYQSDRNADIGHLDIEYPGWMQGYLTFMRLFGALINRRGSQLPTTVAKHMDGDTQYWKRSVQFPDGKTVLFKSHWIYAGSDQLIEYVNALLGLRMAVHVEDDKLIYEGCHFIVKLGKLLIPLPEWLVLGHTRIVEHAVSDDEFEMDFLLKHPLFGEIFRYSGRFKCTSLIREEDKHASKG